MQRTMLYLREEKTDIFNDFMIFSTPIFNSRNWKFHIYEGHAVAVTEYC